MREFLKICNLFCAVLAATAIITTMPDAARAQNADPAQMDQASMRSARDRVFPALLFVRVVMQDMESGERSAREASGSGFLISDDGYFVTNWHVIDKATEVRCLLTDGRSFPADIIGSDKDTDLALGKLRMPEGETVPTSTFGYSSALTECDQVLVMGAPWGMSRSISTGIIACAKRYLEKASEYILWLQTDASISPGNSGGPVVNSSGEVVGITARGTFFGGDLGFAIPSDEAQIIIAQLRQFGRMNWSWTGLELQPLRDFNKNITFPYTNGVMIAETDEGSPARRAGFLDRDRLISVNGMAVTGATIEDLPEIRRLLGLLPKDKPADCIVMRNDQQITLTLTPREKGQVEGDELDFPRWGLTAKTINQFDNPDLHFYQEKGVFIFGTKYPGNAQRAGLQEGDIILRIANQPIETLDELKTLYDNALLAIDQQHRLVLTILRGGLQRQIVLDFSRDYSRR